MLLILNEYKSIINWILSRQLYMIRYLLIKLCLVSGLNCPYVWTSGCSMPNKSSIAWCWNMSSYYATRVEDNFLARLQTSSARWNREDRIMIAVKNTLWYGGRYNITGNCYMCECSNKWNWTCFHVCDLHLHIWYVQAFLLYHILFFNKNIDSQIDLNYVILW